MLLLLLYKGTTDKVNTLALEPTCHGQCYRWDLIIVQDRRTCGQLQTRALTLGGFLYTGRHSNRDIFHMCTKNMVVISPLNGRKKTFSAAFSVTMLTLCSCKPTRSNQHLTRTQVTFAGTFPCCLMCCS